MQDQWGLTLNNSAKDMHGVDMSSLRNSGSIAHPFTKAMCVVHGKALHPWWQRKEEVMISWFN